jgi:hypothetical protein
MKTELCKGMHPMRTADSKIRTCVNVSRLNICRVAIAIVQSCLHESHDKDCHVIHSDLAKNWDESAHF